MRQIKVTRTTPESEMGIVLDFSPLKADYRKNINTPINIENEYWRAGVSDNYIRKLRDNDIYGKWTYPIGVVLYGLLSASKALSDTEIKYYVIGHLEKITKNQS